MHMAYKQRGNPIITVRLPPQLIVQLKEVAKETGTTISELIRLGAETVVKGLGKSQNA
jgi:predicted DNA-binding protein